MKQPKKQWEAMCLILLFLLSGCGKVDEKVPVTDDQTQEIQQDTYNEEIHNKEMGVPYNVEYDVVYLNQDKKIEE